MALGPKVVEQIHQRIGATAAAASNREMVKQHIKKEEEELFPEVESAEMDLDALGKELAERKDELMSEMAE